MQDSGHSCFPSEPACAFAISQRRFTSQSPDAQLADVLLIVSKSTASAAPACLASGLHIANRTFPSCRYAVRRGSHEPDGILSEVHRRAVDASRLVGWAGTAPNGASQNRCPSTCLPTQPSPCLSTARRRENLTSVCSICLNDEVDPHNPIGFDISGVLRRVFSCGLLDAFCASCSLLDAYMHTCMHNANILWFVFQVCLIRTTCPKHC